MLKKALFALRMRSWRSIAAIADTMPSNIWVLKPRSSRALLHRFRAIKELVLLIRGISDDAVQLSIDVPKPGKGFLRIADGVFRDLDVCGEVVAEQAPLWQV